MDTETPDRLWILCNLWAEICNGPMCRI